MQQKPSRSWLRLALEESPSRGPYPIPPRRPEVDNLSKLLNAEFPAPRWGLQEAFRVLCEDLVFLSLPLVRGIDYPDPVDFLKTAQAIEPPPLPKPLPGKQINRQRLLELLRGAWEMEQVSPKAHAPLKRTRQGLERLERLAQTLSKDPNVSELCQRAYRFTQLLAAKNRDDLRTFFGERGKAGRPANLPLDSLLADICAEIKRSTGSPHWHFVLKLVKAFLPRTFPPETGIHHLRTRVATVTRKAR